MKKQMHLLIVILVASVVSFAYFSPFVNNFFAYDSFRYIENIAHGPKTVMLGYNAFRVVSNFIWYPLYYLSGLSPVGYNIFNDVLFATNACMVYLVTWKLWENKELSCLTAIAFVLNTTASDAVFWHMSLSTMLCCTFYLLSLTMYVEYCKSSRRGLWWAALAIYTVAMYTKEDAASLPFILILTEIFYFQQRSDLSRIFRRVAPFFGIIVLYLVSSNVVFHMLHVESETGKFFLFRPLYSMFAGFSVFFLSPNGELELGSPLVWLTAMAIALSFLLVRDRKLLLFGYTWIFFTFLPQSLSRIGQFAPKYIFNSVSRLLYLPEIGAAIVIAALLLQVKKKFGSRIYLPVTVIFFAMFFCLNYDRVQTRGERWREEAAPVQQFLQELKKIVPAFPENSYVTVINAPTGRAYVQQSLRAFYQNPKITWITDPRTFTVPAGASAVIINCQWTSPRQLQIELIPFSSKYFL